MTQEERDQLSQLREELHDYHVDVQVQNQRLAACQEDVAGMHSDLYGLPGSKGHGLMGDVAKLQYARQVRLTVAQCAWGVFIVVLSVGCAYLMRR